MNNKGTEALIKSDVQIIEELLGNVSISVSTTDVEGVKRVGVRSDIVLPLLLSIPYSFADNMTKRFRISRYSIKYKILAFMGVLNLFVGIVLLIFSTLLTRIGLRPLFRSTALKRIKDCDLVVSCSDENFKEAASLLPTTFYWLLNWWSILFVRTIDITIAKFFRKPVIIFPNSIGPFKTGVGRFLGRLALNNANIVLIREKISFKIVEDLNISPPRILTSDSALLFKTSKRFELNAPKNAIGVCPGVYAQTLSMEKVQNYIVEHAHALDMAIEKLQCEIIFLPHFISGFENDDLDISRQIMSKMRNKTKAKIVRVESLDEFKSYLESMSMIISSKLHPAILGSSGFVPTLCIAYDQKQVGFFDTLMMPENVVAINDITSELLFSKISQIWMDKDNIRKNLEIIIPQLQKNIKEAIRIALSQSINRK
ncbi:polysaccharide pyruvyl transferase family protein [Candidatus Bathyarchaeota archaeon]|nr:polysaccharide pyruvyl transferase family protein [Candidatus Bathyarchaeota archaeon]